MVVFLVVFFFALVLVPGELPLAGTRLGLNELEPVVVGEPFEALVLPELDAVPHPASRAAVPRAARRPPPRRRFRRKTRR